MTRLPFHSESEDRILKQEKEITDKYANSEEFKQGNSEFRSKWFYQLVKICVITLIVLGYLFSFIMFGSPFIGWYINDVRLIMAGIPILIFSPHAFMYIFKMQKNSKHYFKHTRIRKES